MSLLAHGIIDADVAETMPVDDLADAVGGTVSMVTDGGLAVVVSHLDGPEVLPSRGNLLGHARVLETVGASTTVLPLRFGVVVDDAATLRVVHLEPVREHLHRELERFEDTEEWRLRGRYHEAEVIEQVLAADPRAARLKGRDRFEDRMELGERIVKGIEARREVDLADVDRTLTPHVRSMQQGSVTEPLDAFSVSLLVAEDQRDGFDRAVDDHGAQVATTLTLELVGPMPPFSFVTQEADAWD